MNERVTRLTTVNILFMYNVFPIYTCLYIHNIHPFHFVRVFTLWHSFLFIIVHMLPFYWISSAVATMCVCVEAVEGRFRCARFASTGTKYLWEGECRAHVSMYCYRLPLHCQSASESLKGCSSSDALRISLSTPMLFFLMHSHQMS